MPVPDFQSFFKPLLEIAPDGNEHSMKEARQIIATVGRPEIQKFVGALHGKRAKKGVFITTGRFSDYAQTYVATIDPKVILIDGKMLADLMIDYGLGTNITARYEIRKIDSDYFSEE